MGFVPSNYIDRDGLPVMSCTYDYRTRNPVKALYSCEANTGSSELSLKRSDLLILSDVSMDRWIAELMLARKELFREKHFGERWKGLAAIAV